MKIRMSQLLSAAAVLALCAGSANAAVVSWSSAGINGVGDASVSTAGAGEYAYNFGSASDATVNTVLFTGTATGAVTDAASEGNITIANADNGTDGANFGNQGPDIETLMDSASWANRAPNPLTEISLNNLTIGQDYLVQIFSSDTRGTRNAFVAIDTGLSGEFIDTVGNGSVGGGGGDGIVINGTFTADATSQTFTIAHDPATSGNANYNGIQVRNVTVPEPGSLALLGLGGLMIARRRRNG